MKFRVDVNFKMRNNIQSTKFIKKMIFKINFFLKVFFYKNILNSKVINNSL